MTTLPLELQLKLRAFELHVPTLTEIETKQRLVQTVDKAWRFPPRNNLLYRDLLHMDRQYKQLLGKSWGVCDG